MPPIDYAAQIAALARTVAGVDERASARLEQAIRQEFGGRSVPIASQPPVNVDMTQVDAGLRARMPVTEIARQIGVSRTTLYRHLRARATKVPPRPRDGTPPEA